MSMIHKQNVVIEMTKKVKIKQEGNHFCFLKKTKSTNKNMKKQATQFDFLFFKLKLQNETNKEPPKCFKQNVIETLTRLKNKQQMKRKQIFEQLFPCLKISRFFFSKQKNKIKEEALPPCPIFS